MGDRLKGKVALVSGAGSIGPGWGNGKATAVLFAREGAKVLAGDIKLAAAQETKRIIEAEGGVCEAMSGNAADAGDVAATDADARAVDGALRRAHRLLRGLRRVATGDSHAPSREHDDRRGAATA